MKQALPLMLELCELDGQLHAIQTQLKLYPKMIADLDAKEATARKKIAAADERFHKSREIRRKSELDVKAEKDKIGRYMVQQNQVKSNKEYEALTHEVNTCKARIDELDFAGIEALEVEEKSEAEKKQLEVALEKLLAEHKTERERIAAQTESKKASLTTVESQRETKFEALDEEFREMYGLLNDRYPGAALSEISDGHCKGCGMSLNKHVIQDIQKAEKMIRCESCMRILYDPVSA